MQSIFTSKLLISFEKTASIQNNLQFIISIIFRPKRTKLHKVQLFSKHHSPNTTILFHALDTSFIRNQRQIAECHFASNFETKYAQLVRAHCARRVLHWPQPRWYFVSHPRELKRVSKSYSFHPFFSFHHGFIKICNVDYSISKNESLLHNISNSVGIIQNFLWSQKNLDFAFATNDDRNKRCK